MYSTLNWFQCRVQQSFINLLRRIYIEKMCILNLKSYGENEQKPHFVLTVGRWEAGKLVHLFSLLIFKESKNPFKMVNIFAWRSSLQAYEDHESCNPTLEQKAQTHCLSGLSSSSHAKSNVLLVALGYARRHTLPQSIYSSQNCLLHATFISPHKV